MQTTTQRISNLEVQPSLVLESLLQRVWRAPWQIVALVSVAAGIGSGWRASVHQAGLVSPLGAMVTMILATFAGWYIWSFFTHLTDVVIFRGHSDYQGTLNAFGRAYCFQVLFFFTFTNPLGIMWGWIAYYATIAVWGIIGPRHLGMRTWQAILAATLGMLLWMGCLLILTFAFVSNGTYPGVGAFLVV
jgi:hypothetical protein